jgi:hypothetical protein
MIDSRIYATHPLWQTLTVNPRKTTMNERLSRQIQVIADDAEGRLLGA